MTVFPFWLARVFKRCIPFGSSTVLAVLTFTLPIRSQTGIPVATPMEVRLTERLSTQRSRVGFPVHAILTAPVLSGDKVVLPLGSEIEGRVLQVNSVHLGFGHETSSIGIELQRIVLPGGNSVPLQARLAQIENSREIIDSKGRVSGVRSTSTLSHKTSGALGTLALGNPIALIFATAASASLLRFSDPEISLPAYTELVLLTTQPIAVGNANPPVTPTLADSTVSQHSLYQLIRRQPFRTVTAAKHTSSDIVNLMLIGEEPSILRAMEAAGWLQVDGLNAASTYRTIRSISEQQAYRTAPMSALLLENRKPTYTLAKTLDTFSKRHHLRVFATADRWQEESVWLASATQDIGIGLSSTRKSLIHQIDHNIDHERTKVVNDLLLTGCVTGMNLVSRPWLPKQPKNGTGEDIVTDTQVAVVRIDQCNHPMNVPAADQTSLIPVREAKLVGAVRQTTLTLRSMMLRDNLAVTAYGGVRTGLGLRHPKPPEQPITVSSIIDTNGYRFATSSGPAEQTFNQKLYNDSDDKLEGNVVASDPVSRARFPSYSVELGLHVGYAGYAGGDGGAVGYLFTPSGLVPKPIYLLVIGNELSAGYNLGGYVTLTSQKHVSHEISFDYDRTGFLLQLASLKLPGNDDATDPVSASQYAFDPVTLATSEVAYNVQYLPLRRSSRWQPYLTAGPSFRLMHLTEAPITKASPWFRLGLSTVGAITAAYHFGSIPPLEGGGIFQAGFQYGAGLKYRVGRHLLLRADYKETLTGQPDFWTKSKNDIFAPDELPGYSLTVVGPVQDGVMRQQRATMGVSFLF